MLQKSINQNQEEVSFLVWSIANSLIAILAELNDHNMRNNWGKQQLERSAFEILPENFINRYELLVTAPPQEVLASDLVDDVYLLLKNWLERYEQEQPETIDEFVES